MDEKGHISQTDDNSQTAEGQGSANVKIDLHLPKDSFWKQPAIYIALLAALIAFWAEREARLTEYYAIDLEMKMAQAGMHPPADPWGKRKEEK